MASPEADHEMLSVEVVYALPEQQFCLSLQLPGGSTALQAVQASGLLQKFPELATEQLLLGIYAQRVGPEQPLRAFDRVEIYRPLLIDPKDARRQRAARQK